MTLLSQLYEVLNVSYKTIAQNGVGEILDELGTEGDILFDYDNITPLISGKYTRRFYDFGSVANNGEIIINPTQYGFYKVTALGNLTITLSGIPINSKLYSFGLSIINPASPSITWDSKFRPINKEWPTPTVSGKDNYMCITYDGGSTYDLFIAGQDIGQVVV